jgi:hypothetical protein
MSHRRKFAGLTAALLTTLGLAVAPAQAAAAPVPAPGCYASTCNGQDPQAKGCSPDAVTVKDFNAHGYYLELRLSPACHAAWVRVKSVGNWGQTGTFRIERQIPASYYSNSFAAGEAGTKWTRMYSWDNTVRGWLQVNLFSTGGMPIYTTPWY